MSLRYSELTNCTAYHIEFLGIYELHQTGMLAMSHDVFLLQAFVLLYDHRSDLLNTIQLQLTLHGYIAKESPKQTVLSILRLEEVLTKCKQHIEQKWVKCAFGL